MWLPLSSDIQGTVVFLQGLRVGIVGFELVRDALKRTRLHIRSNEDLDHGLGDGRARVVRAGSELRQVRLARGSRWVYTLYIETW